LIEAETVSQYVDLAEDSLMYGSIFRSFTANKLGRGGVRYVLDVSYTSYDLAGMSEIAANLNSIRDIFCAITSQIDFNQLVMLARSGDETSITRLKSSGVHII
jgi:flagellar basal body-associated protein FliL